MVPIDNQSHIFFDNSMSNGTIYITLTKIEYIYISISHKNTHSNINNELARCRITL